MKNERIQSIVQKFARMQDERKEQEIKYQQRRVRFNEIMDDYFKELDNKRKNVTIEDTDGSLIVVSRVAPTSIKWLPDKLKKRVTKETWKKIVKKRYEIVDIKGLTKYLQSCGVDPLVFKGYIEVTETVDPVAIKRLGDLGELTPHNIAGCYIVECSKSYYQVHRKANANSENEDTE